MSHHHHPSLRPLALLSALSLALLLTPTNGYAQRALDVEPVVSGLSAPLYAISPPGDRDRLFIVEQDGLIKILRDGAILSSPFLDVTGLTGASGERGLLGLAFHPDYAQNGWFFINYTNGGGNTRVDRISVDPNDPDCADLSTRVNIFSQNQPFPNHNGGCLAFGADGFLYIGMGDGGGAGDTSNRAQNGLKLLGKMLRLDVDHGLPYTIPADNPFVNDNGVLDEIWALGLRNPWRFSFDRLSGDLWIGDVGQNAWEEIDFEAAGDGGRNYGWRLMEGLHCFNPANNCDTTGLTMPVHEYDHGGTPFRCSVTGGFVYRGQRMATMQGRYFYADYCSGQVWSFRLEGGVVTDLLDHSNDFGTLSNITSFGQDGNGELYAVSQGGTIYRIVPDGLSLDSDPLLVGSLSTWQIAGATPSSPVWVSGSLQGLGSTPVRPLAVVLDLSAPSFFLAVTADHQGQATFHLQIPQALAGHTVWSQAFEFGRVSNVQVRPIQ